MHPSLTQVVAEMKAEDLQREAAHYRLVRQVARSRKDVKGLRLSRRVWSRAQARRQRSVEC
jgi:hypothetical protein